MRVIRNGLIYDTDKAKHLAADSFSYPGDFSYWLEELYKTPNGRYFLYGEGGPKSKYAKYLGNGNTGGSSDIVPLSGEQALEWMESHDISPEIIEREFPGALEEA